MVLNLSLYKIFKTYNYFRKKRSTFPKFLSAEPHRASFLFSAKPDEKSTKPVFSSSTSERDENPGNGFSNMAISVMLLSFVSLLMSVARLRFL